jgi:hypothetical protein
MRFRFRHPGRLIRPARWALTALAITKIGAAFSLSALSTSQLDQMTLAEFEEMQL